VSGYTEDINPYKQWHMRRAFRLGWETAELDLDRRQAQAWILGARLNRMTTAAWWKGFDAKRSEH
jgi:hypothetical protein